MACPFAGRAAAAPQQQHDAAAPPATCPFAGRAAAAPPSHPQQQQHDAPPPPAATCPLGFGSARGPKLSSLHCPVCRGLLFDAHTTSACQHTFCAACVARTRDCPTCGRDIEGLEPNPELAGLVDTFLDTHSQSPELVAAQAELGPLPDNSPASFWMAQGLKSLAGGNVHAALHRLGRCRQALLDAAASPGLAQQRAPGAEAGASDQLEGGGGGPAAAAQQPGGSVSAACQLATVCGCLGDCYARLGDAAQAEQLYSASLAAVEPHCESSADAAHAMSVTLSKLGDARYLAQQLPAAKQLYRQALQLRQCCCGPLSGGQAGPAAQLDQATALIKVADVCKALGEADEAEGLLRRAHGLCHEVHELDAEPPPAVARKLAMLLDVLQAQGLGLGARDGAAAG